MDTLKLHWNYTEKPLDEVHWNYTGITLKCHWMDTLKLNCTSSAPQMHLQCTPNAPSTHPKYTSNAPQMHLQRTPNAPPAHLEQCTSNSAPPSSPTSFIYLHPHLQRTPTAPPSTSTAPPSTTTFTNPCLAIKSGVHLSAPQKCTPPRVRCAPPSTSAHRGGRNSISMHHRIQITLNNCPCRSKKDDDGVRRHPDKTRGNTVTGVRELCPAPGVRTNWRRVAYPAGF